MRPHQFVERTTEGATDGCNLSVKVCARCGAEIYMFKRQTLEQVLDIHMSMVEKFPDFPDLVWLEDCDEEIVRNVLKS